MRSPVETRCAGVADMCIGRLYQKESRGERWMEILRGTIDCVELGGAMVFSALRCSRPQI
jgi:hypothetical protein